MSSLFFDEVPTSFNGDISQWDVSRVIAMYGMFGYASSFTGDISKWDVSSVTDMSLMFYGALSFNRDIAKWDVSSVKRMERMFYGTTSFTRTLCGAAWVNSQASKSNMFVRSFGSISACEVDNTCVSIEMLKELIMMGNKLVRCILSGNTETGME